MTNLAETVKRIREVVEPALDADWAVFSEWEENPLDLGYAPVAVTQAESAYIAAVDPTTVSAILAELERVTGELAAARAEIVRLTTPPITIFTGEP